MTADLALFLLITRQVILSYEMLEEGKKKTYIHFYTVKILFKNYTSHRS